MSDFEHRESIVLENQGQKIFGVLHRPNGVKKCPMVFLCHGFAGNKCGRHRIYVNLSTDLAKHGIGSLRIDFRGSGDSEGEISDMTLSGEISDALLSLKHLESLPWVDTDRIGILGRSLGGAVAVLLASQYKRTKSLALWAPVFHAEQWKKEWEDAKHKLKNNTAEDVAMLFNNQVAGKEFVMQLFQMDLEKELLALNSTPLLHIHGEADKMVHLEHADHYERCRKDLGVPTIFVRIPDCDHDFTPINCQKKAIFETRNWFMNTL